MAVNGTLIGPFTVLVTGMDLEAMTQAEWARLIGVMGRNLQKRVARSFAAQRVAGSTMLLKNTPEYDRAKVAAGYDARRGHRTNQLQRALDGARLFMVTITPQTAKTAAARIIMEEGMLHSLVPHSVYYEEKKVTRDGILALAASWVRDEAAKLRAKELAAISKRVRVSQNVVRAGIGGRRSAALAILDGIKARSGQDVLRMNIDARRMNAARVLKRIGR